MAPTPRSHHLKEEAGLHSDEYADKSRGRRYFPVTDSIMEHKSLLPEEHAPTPFCALSPRFGKRSPEDHLGLTSVELSKVNDSHHRRGRRHICHGGSLGKKTPSTPSLASEAVSEESAQDHLGHRDKVVKCWAETHEDLVAVPEFEEPIGGATSHHLARRKGRLGWGKKRFPDTWTHCHRSARMDDPGGEDAFSHDGKFTSFLGPAKRHHGKSFESGHLSDHLFDDFVDPNETHHKKLFKHEEAVHGTEEIPIGVSTQIDLHTRGFLGKSKKNFEGDIIHKSSDPISDYSAEAKESSLSSYGLNHRGRRKFLVQSNLEAGCRHNMRVSQEKSMPTLRSLSVPILERDLPPNQTPYYQDDLPAEQMAQKELLHDCSNRKPRHHKTEVDQAWSSLVWTPRAVDQATASAFIEGKNQCTTDEEHREYEWREYMGRTKRSFGNAHNKSDFKFEYNDDPGRKFELLDSSGFRFGHGHGRRKFYVGDHLDKDDDGVECYVSASGAVLGKVKHKKVEDHLDASNPAPVSNAIFLDPDGKSISTKPRHHVMVKDNVTPLMDNDLASEDSNTLGVVGMRRKSDNIRPVSARRFPEKDTGRVQDKSRSLTPRRTPRQPLAERPNWKA